MSITQLLKIANGFELRLAAAGFPSVEEIYRTTLDLNEVYGRVDDFADTTRAVVQQFMQGKSPQKILQELIMRGIDPQLADLTIKAAELLAKDLEMPNEQVA
jgi:uncharacterized protein with gpF-like domain